MQQAIEACRRGLAGQLVVGWLDRLSRRLLDLLAILDDELKAAEFHSITDSVDSLDAIGESGAERPGLSLARRLFLLKKTLAPVLDR